jgi:hypothetical protein
MIRLSTAAAAVVAAICAVSCERSALAISSQWIRAAEITAPAPAIGAHFGAAVALSADTLVVGAPDADNGQGAAYVFRRVGNVWSLRQMLSTQVSAGAHFGARVALSGDNLAVAAPDWSDGAVGAGYVRLYRYDAGADHWQSLVAFESSTANERFGTAVAISANYLAIGAPGHAANAGRIYFYDFQPSPSAAWIANQVGFLDSGETDALFGSSAALFESASPFIASTLAVGAPGASPFHSSVAHSGAIAVFKRAGATWSSYAAIPENTPHTDDAFGSSVAVRADLVIGGSPGRDDPLGAAHAGSVGVFRDQGNSYSIDEEIFPANGSSGSLFGSHVAAHFDGTLNRVLVGAPLGNQPGHTDAGSAFFFAAPLSGTGWTQDDRVSLEGDAVAGDHFGSDVTLASGYAAVGVPDRVVNTLSGAGMVRILIPDEIFASGFE